MLKKSHKTNTERSQIPFIQLPLMLMSYITWNNYRNKEINIPTILLTSLQTLLKFCCFFFFVFLCVFLLMFFLWLRIQPGSHMALRFLHSMVVPSSSVFLSFMTLTLLKHIGHLFCTLSFIWVLWYFLLFKIGVICFW